MSDNSIDYNLPARFDGLIDGEQYALLLDLCLGHLESRAIIHSVQDGVISLGVGEISDMQCALDNLVRQIVKLPQPSWRERVIGHFGQLWITLAEHDESMKLLQNFDEVSSLLRLRVYPSSFGDSDLAQNLVSRVDFPGTFTNLVLDYDNRFQLVTRDICVLWEKDEEALFEIAQQNVNKEKLDINRIEVKNGSDIFALLNRDLASSFLLDFEKNLPSALGKYGSLVAIPAKNAAFCVPIGNEDYKPYLKLLAPLMMQFFQQGPGQITTQFYWYYKGTFVAFSKNKKSEYEAPEALLKLLNSP
ncbi:MAG: hypothetical protein AB8F95_21535 [Bacteroidia bacterium]